MIVTFKEVCNTWNTKRKDKIIGTYKVEADTLQQCLKKIYPHHRSLRYCSGYRLEMDDPSIQAAFNDYCRNVGVQEFYGGGTVD